MDPIRLPKIPGFFIPPEETQGAGEGPANNPGGNDPTVHFNYSKAQPIFREKMKQEPGLVARDDRTVELAVALAMRRLNRLGQHDGVEEFFDGFFPRELVVSGESSYYGIKESEVKEIIGRAIGATRGFTPITVSAHQAVWLNFSEGLSFFFPAENKDDEGLQRTRQGAVEQRVLKILEDIFQNYEVSLSSDEPKGLKPDKYVKVDFLKNEPTRDTPQFVGLGEIIADPRWNQEDFFESVHAQFGPASVGNAENFEAWFKDTNRYEQGLKDFWTKKLENESGIKDVEKIFGFTLLYGRTKKTTDLSEPYRGNKELGDEVEVYSSSLLSKKWHANRLVVNPNENQQVAEAKMERLSQLLVYIVFHELMHTFGMDHLAPRQNRESFMMDKSAYFDLSPLWKSGMGMEEKKHLTTLKRLLRLTPYDQIYLDYILKKRNQNQTGQMEIPKGEREKMTCNEIFNKFIDGRCYEIVPDYQKDGDLYDLVTKDNGKTEARGVEILDEEDIYFREGSDVPEHVPIDKLLLRKEYKYRLGFAGTLRVGHLFGQRLEKLNLNYHRDYLRNSRDEDFQIWAFLPVRVEAALAAYTTLSIDIPEWKEGDRVPWWDPISDHDSSVRIALCRLHQIAAGEKKPLPLYEKDGKRYLHPEYEKKNREHALELIQYYWRMGSEKAGDILKELKAEQKSRFDWAIEKLKEKYGGGLVAEEQTTASSCEPFANMVLPKSAPQTAATENCKADSVFPDHPLKNNFEAAKKCAELLTQTTGRPHDVEPQTENMSDGFPHMVSQTHYQVVEK